MLKLRTLLVEDFVFYDKPMSEVKLKMYLEILKHEDPVKLEKAIRLLRMDPTRKFMPMPAEYIAAIPDGHPTANESWAMIPKNEDDSVIWSEEMRMAYAVSRPLILDGNITGAFFAYKEAYDRLLLQSRAQRKSPDWSPSFGMNVGGRDAAVLDAVEKKRINLVQASNLRPEIEYHPKFEQLAIAAGYERLQIEAPKNVKEVPQVIKFLTKEIDPK